MATKKLLLVGAGFRAELHDNNITLIVGLSHPVSIPIPQGITVCVQNNSSIEINGINSLVGQFASQIRAVKPPNSYTGKGIRYSDEKIFLKKSKKSR